jgi:hypothetical protein
MSSKLGFIKPLAIAVLALAAGASHAALTVYTSQASFSAAVTNSGIDTFAGLSITSATPGPLTRSAGSYGYTATATTNDFFGAGSTADPWLSVATSTDSIRFSNFTGGTMSAIGGNFFNSNLDGLFAAGNITLVATDASGATLTQTITGASSGSFLGFTSTSAITSLVVTAVQPTSGSLWPTVDNLTLAAAVPEPETYAMLLAGLAMLAALARRRQR